jgi:hypothetical protein
VYGNVHFGVRGICLTIAVAAALVLAATASGRTAASVRITTVTPLTVVGRGFEPRERVTLRVTIGRAAVRRVALATGLGRIRVRFSPLLAADVCGGYVVVTASGSKGSRASTRRPCLTPDPQR